MLRQGQYLSRNYLEILDESLDETTKDKKVCVKWRLDHDTKGRIFAVGSREIVPLNDALEYIQSVENSFALYVDSVWVV